MYETYQDHPKQAKGNIRVVLAIVLLVCAIGAGIFLITRLVSKPLSKEDARAKAGIVYDSSAVEGGWDNLSPEEIAENPSLGMVQLYYFPAKTANAKYAIVVPGNGGNTTAELNEGASIANQLHELGYAAFVLRYRSFLNASDNAPLYDIANAVKYLTENADQFGVQRENYALMGFSSGGHIVGLIGSDNEKFGYKAFGLPQPAALLLGYPINDFFEVKPLYQLAGVTTGPIFRMW